MAKYYDTEHDYQHRKKASLTGWGSTCFENSMALAIALALIDGHVPHTGIDLGAGCCEDRKSGRVDVVWEIGLR